ncbi:DUF2269 family protein [Neobacillus rhizosphaerae]|uniref:DUF2269 family protein n=1 Tax=Neobacillus rhizosphaerae TaxID=2880965 RepID=UPI003D2C2602
MKKLGPTGMKWLKIVHIVLVALFFGGIMSSTALSFWPKSSAFLETFEIYKHMVTISDLIVRTGAVGTLLVGIVYSVMTPWGFFKHRWVTVKWGLFVGQTVVGIFVVDRLMMANMALLETERSQALMNPVFIENETLRQYAVIFQVVVTLFIFCISVFKPWKKKKRQAAKDSLINS